MILAALASTLLAAGAVDSDNDQVDTRPILTLEQVDAHFRSRPFNRGYYPEAAAYRHVEGQATIVCRIGGAGELNHCRVESQDPPRGGFGTPTIRYFTDLLVVGPTAKDGTPTAGRLIRLHKDWRITGGSAYDLR